MLELHSSNYSVFYGFQVTKNFCSDRSATSTTMNTKLQRECDLKARTENSVKTQKRTRRKPAQFQLIQTEELNKGNQS